MKNIKEKFVIVLPNIRSAHNVGAIFRTADAMGADKIFTTGWTSHPPHPRLAKVALGAEKWVKHKHYKRTEYCLKQLKKKGYNIVALEQTKDSKNIFDWKPKFPMALVLGNEVTGVTENFLKLCDEAVEIPMHGKKESLNVSIAGGVALYYIYQSLKPTT